MRRIVFRLFAPIVCALLFWGGGCAKAFAQSSSIFSSDGDHDVARAWLDLLFRGDPLPDGLSSGASNLAFVAGALHRALGIYSTGILVLAGLLLFYNLAVLIVETAHYGVALGRRSAQVWAPFRLIIAIGFLVPVSGGLNAGQYLVAWMAGEGSALASNVWDIAASGMKGNLAGLALPKGPDVAGFVAGGIEMELCRALYRREFDALQSGQPSGQSGAAERAAGDIGDIEKLPRTRFTDESWQYANRLHAATPLCGAYRFAAVHMPDSETNGTLDRLGNGLADFSRAQADRLIAAAQPLAQSNMGVFLGETAGPGLHDDAALLIASDQEALDQRMNDLIAADPGAADQALDASASAGWITAGGLMMELARRQQSIGALASHALPAVQSPLLDQGDFLHPTAAEAIAADPLLRTVSAEDLAPVPLFYAQMQRTMRLAHDWLYNRQLADMPIALGNPFELRDQLNAARDPDSVSSLFSHVFNDAAAAYGVWNRRPANPSDLAFDNDRPLLALPVAAQNAVAGLAEFGRRQTALGNYLFGIAGPDIAPSGTLVYTMLLGAAGLGFMASGFALMFLVPLLPFLRFFLGILAWLLSVIEAIVAIPLVALAHLNFNGEGLSGNAARHAYLLWLNILVRPALTLFGFIAGLLLFAFGVVFLGVMFDQLARLAAPDQGSLFVTINVALTFLYTVLVLAAANAAFKGITALPELAFKWLGGFIMLPAERADAPVAAGAVAGAALPLSISPSLSAPRGPAGSVESRSSAEARALGLRTGLFPNYRDDAKTGRDPYKEITHAPAESPGKAEAPRDPATVRVVPDVERRDIQKPDRMRAHDPNAPAGKKDAPKDVGKNIAKPDIVKGIPVRDDQDKSS